MPECSKSTATRGYDNGVTEAEEAETVVACTRDMDVKVLRVPESDFRKQLRKLRENKGGESWRWRSRRRNEVGRCFFSGEVVAELNGLCGWTCQRMKRSTGKLRLTKVMKDQDRQVQCLALNRVKLRGFVSAIPPGITNAKSGRDRMR